MTDVTNLNFSYNQLKQLGEVWMKHRAKEGKGMIALIVLSFAMLIASLGIVSAQLSRIKHSNLGGVPAVTSSTA